MKTPAFQFYPKDWLASFAVSQMTLEQEGAYIRLLCYAWLDEDCSIPADRETLCRLLRITPEGWLKGGCSLVEAQFKQHPTKQDRLVNERLLEERRKQAVWREKSSSGGKKSAELRKQQGLKENNTPPKGGSRVVEGWFNQTSTLQSSSSVCSLHSNISPQPVAADIYAAFPKKVAKPKALAAIEKQIKGGVCPSCLLAKTRAFAVARNGELEFCPHPTTWFNQQRFNDDPQTWKPAAPTTQPTKEKYVYRCV